MAAQSYPPESDPVATALVEALDARVEALEEGGVETDPIAGPALVTHAALTTGAHNLTALLGAKAAAEDLTAHVNDTSDAHDASAISVASPLTEGNAQAELERLSLAVGSGSGLPDGGTVGDFVRNTAPGEGAWDTVTAADVGAIPAADITAIDIVTQVAYDALSPPAATTLYVIVG